MTEVKVDLLLKNEIFYENIIRGVKVEYSESVMQMRKLLRQALRQGKERKISNLSPTFKLSDELLNIEISNTKFEELIDELKDSKRTLDIARCQARLEHWELRAKGLLSCKLSDEQASCAQKAVDNFVKLINELKEINIDRELERNLVRKLSEQNEEEEEMLATASNLDNSVFKPSETQIEKVNEITIPKVNNDIIPNYQIQTDSSIFSKIPNPLHAFLKELQLCNGLNVPELLKFIESILKIKDVKNIDNQSFYDIILSYTEGPLQTVTLNSKRLSHELEQWHEICIKTFIPFNLRENFIKHNVNRVQRPDENLSLYIYNVKNSARVLCCKYSETQLVEIIKLGLKPEERNKFVFTNNPTTFQDLDQLCILAQNVAYNDYDRYQNHQSSSNTYKPGNVSSRLNIREIKPNAERIKKCYHCNRQGHIAAQCYFNPSSKNYKTNFKKPKNL